MKASDLHPVDLPSTGSSKSATEFACVPLKHSDLVRDSRDSRPGGLPLDPVYPK
jgi:hypothetical protein